MWVNKAAALFFVSGKALWILQAFFLIVIFCLVAGKSIKYGLKGQEVKMKPPFQDQQPDQILWIHNDYKVVEFNGKEEKVYRKFKNRTTLDWKSAELHLTGLRSEDSGLYEVELYIRKKTYSFNYELQVIDQVATPTISCETNSSRSSNASGLLTCSSSQADIQYEWSFYGNTQPGPQLTIVLGDEGDERVYGCRASNPLSNQTAEFTARDCYSGERSFVVVAVVVTTVIIATLLLAAVLIYRKCRKELFVSPRFHNNKIPPLDQKGGDEDGEGPNPPEKEASDVKSSTKEPVSDSNKNKEDCGNSPDLTNSNDEDGDPLREKTETTFLLSLDGPNSAVGGLDDETVEEDEDETQSLVTSTPKKESEKKNNKLFIPATEPPQAQDSTDTRKADRSDIHPMNETSFVTYVESMSNLQSEEGTSPTVSSGVAEQNKENSSDGDDEAKGV